MKEIIVRVRQSNSNGQKIVTIPKREVDIQAGDYVIVTKLKRIKKDVDKPKI